MCQQAVTHFQCDHSLPMAEGVTRCEWAQLSGRECPDFQMLPDHARSTCVYETCLSCVAHGGKSKKEGKSLRKKGKTSRW